MAARFGRCVNFGACGKADAKANIPIADGVADAVCPECGKPLTPAAAAKSGSPFMGLLVAVVIVLLAGFVIGKLFLGHGSTPTAVATIAPAAAAPALVVRGAAALALCGSNTIGSQLGPDLARGFLASMGSTPPSALPSGNDEQLVRSDLDGKSTDVKIAAHGTGTAFVGLRTGMCQVGMASRRIDSGEAASLHGMGNMLLPASEHVIGLDGIAVIVNPANPVSALSVSQLHDIFSGRIRNWRALGAGAGPIDVFARDDKSGTFDTFKSLVLDKSALLRPARRFESSTALSSAVSADVRAIGFIGLPYVNQTKALRVSSGGAAVVPTPLTVGRESYPLTRRLFLYTASSPQNLLVGRFVSFVQSDSGQKIVNRDGFVGTVTALAAAKSNSRGLPAGAPRRYQKLVDTFDQASFNFYFNSGSDVLDNKAFVDVGRLVALVSASGNTNKSIVLAGFADSTGAVQNNVALSFTRAQAARRELEAQGIRVKDTLGFGQELPIRDNSTEQGREKNRRVEIFITR